MKDLSLLHIALIYLAVMNMFTFFMYGIDKWRAKRSKWRISEATLLGMAVFGGCIGAWLGMKIWHHKILHKGGNRDVLALQDSVLISKFCIGKIGHFNKRGKERF